MCDIGFHNTSNGCRACQRGEYKDFKGDSICSECGPNKNTQGIQSTNNTECCELFIFRKIVHFFSYTVIFIKIVNGVVCLQQCVVPDLRIQTLMGTVLNVKSDSINPDWETKFVHPAAPTKQRTPQGRITLRTVVCANTLERLSEALYVTCYM